MEAAETAVCLVVKAAVLVAELGADTPEKRAAIAEAARAILPGSARNLPETARHVRSRAT